MKVDVRPFPVRKEAEMNPPNSRPKKEVVKTAKEKFQKRPELSP